MGQLLQPIVAGECDFVIGSRLRGTREPGSMQLSQIFAGWLAGLLLPGYSIACPTPTWDPFAPSSGKHSAACKCAKKTYGWNLEMQMRAAQCNLRIREIPVSCRKRAGGISKVAGSLSGSIRAALRITQTHTSLRVATTPKP